MRTAYCSACQREELVDKHWLAFYIDSDGDFVSTQPERGCDIDYERPNTVFACGQHTALVLFERWLHTRSFTAEHTTNLNRTNLLEIA